MGEGSGKCTSISPAPVVVGREQDVLGSCRICTAHLRGANLVAAHVDIQLLSEVAPILYPFHAQEYFESKQPWF